MTITSTYVYVYPYYMPSNFAHVYLHATKLSIKFQHGEMR